MQLSSKRSRIAISLEYDSVVHGFLSSQFPYAIATHLKRRLSISQSSSLPSPKCSLVSSLGLEDNARTFVPIQEPAVTFFLFN